MRVIKFRAWDKELKGWLQAFVVAEDGKVYEPSCKNEWTDNVDLMQFTGLLDKKGKEIYEGDILRRGLTFDEVIFDEGAFCIKFYSQGLKKTYIHSMKSTLFSQINRWEIVGNIYENPELLEGVE